MEEYISTTWNQASGAERWAVEFAMTIYRRRLFSSFRALRATFENHLDVIVNGAQAPLAGLDEDAPDDEALDEVPDAEEIEVAERRTLAIEERAEIEALLRCIQALPPDSKLASLRNTLTALREKDYTQAMVFTQYTDTIAFLRDAIRQGGAPRLMCFSGRGGEIPAADGASWRSNGALVAGKSAVQDTGTAVARGSGSDGAMYEGCSGVLNGRATRGLRPEGSCHLIV